MVARPSDFHPQLTDARLRVIAETLLEVRYETEMALDSVLDDGYTRGTTTFGRQRNAVIHLCHSKKHPWLELRNAAMDLTFAIDGVPCRFFADDPKKPKKPGFWRRNSADSLIPIEAGKPEMYRFIVEKPQGPDEDAEVFFIGFDGNQQVVVQWRYSTSTPSISSTDERLPNEIPIPAPKLMKPPRVGDSEAAAGDENEPA